MTDAGWAWERAIKIWKGFRGGLIDYGTQLLEAEHARSVRICRQARMLKFHGLRDTDTNEWLDGYEAACCDILAALQRGRGGKE